MILLNRIASMLSWIFRRRRAEARLGEEMESYVEMSAAAKMRDAASRGAVVTYQ